MEGVALRRRCNQSRFFCFFLTHFLSSSFLLSLLLGLLSPPPLQLRVLNQAWKMRRCAMYYTFGLLISGDVVGARVPARQAWCHPLPGWYHAAHKVVFIYLFIIKGAKIAGGAVSLMGRPCRSHERGIASHIGTFPPVINELGLFRQPRVGRNVQLRRAIFGTVCRRASSRLPPGPEAKCTYDGRGWLLW